MNPSTSMLRASAVTRHYPVAGGTLQALRGVDLEVRQGQTLGLVGESGCGKSTLAKLLLGMETPTSGTVMVDGRPISSYGRLERARLIQPVFQDPYASLNPRMTAASIIGASLEVRGVRAGERKRRVADISAAVGLPSHLLNAYPGQLSGGQRQRVAIARALIGEPAILVCDEPTSALDVSVQSQILNLLSSLQRDFNLTMVLISHNLAVVHHLVDRVAVMYLGAVVEEGATDQVFRAPRHPYTAALLGSVLSPTPGAGLPDVPLIGEFPSPLHPPSGCAFHPRCPRAQDRCTREAPALEGAVHARACHFPLHEETTP